MTNNFALLTGAGYSKNWGGWLASELWAVILGHPRIQQNKDLKDIIWEYRSRGFEEIFGDKRITAKQDNINDYQEIVKDSFMMMHRAIPSNLRLNKLHSFIYKFNTFFTLNQDLFFEAMHSKFNDQSNKYFYPHIKSRSYFQYDLLQGLANNRDFNLDGLMLDATLVNDTTEPYDQANNPLSTIFGLNSQAPQPLRYYKLHGSLNFKDGNKDILIMGSSKKGQIEKIPLLNQYHKDLDDTLKAARKLMIVGYSFADFHINEKIFDAVKNNNLKFWIIDTAPLENLIINATLQEMESDEVKEMLKPQKGMVVGDEEYYKKEIFDKVLFPKYSDFFKMGLISITRDSLSNIFDNNYLELNRINNGFFN